MKKYSLDEILDNDPAGLLNYKKRNVKKSSNQRFVESFLEINEFYRKNSKEPEEVVDDILERRLYSRLKEIRKDKSKVSILKKYDEFSLLSEIVEKDEIKINSIDDIFNNDPLGIFEEDKSSDIFKLKFVSKSKKETFGFSSKRKKCNNFEKYEPIFRQVQSDLKKGKRILEKTIESELKEGRFCVLDGVLLMIKKINSHTRGNSGKLDRRTEIVFENGTCSNMLLRSLGKGLWKNGKTVSVLRDDKNILKNITKQEGNLTGRIYVLESLSNDYYIKTSLNLYKIGFSVNEVEERIRNAENDPTFLMAPVKVVDSYELYDLIPQKVEHILHTFFHECRYDLEVTDRNGEIFKPKEWFVVPRGVIKTVIEKIEDGTIKYYKYDADKEEVVLRK